MRNAAILSLTLLTVGFAPVIEGGTTHLPVFILKMLVLALFAVYLFGGLRRGSIVMRRTALDVPIALFFLAIVVSALLAPYKYMALTWVHLMFYYILFFYLSVCTLSEPGALVPALVTVMGVGFFEAALGVGQWAAGSTRAVGTFFNPNMLAGYLAPVALIALGILLFRDSRPSGKARMAALALLVLLCVACVLLTGSRGGMLALSAGLLIVLWARYRVWAAVAVAVLVVAVLAIPNPVSERVFGKKDIFSYSRVNIWTSSLSMARDHPFGVGAGNFKYYWDRYNFPVDEAVSRYAKRAGTSHGEYLQVLAETGFLGLAVFLSGVLLAFKVLRDAFKKADRGLAAGLAGGVIAILVHGLVDSNLHEPGIAFLLVFLMSMAAVVGGASTPVVIETPASSKRRVAMLSTVFLLLIAAWAAMPALAYYYNEKSMDKLRSGDPSGALRDAGRALLLEPGNAPYHEGRASILYNIYQRGGADGLFTDAVSELDEAVRLNPEESRFPAVRARLLYAAASRSVPEARGALLASALTDTRRALLLNPYGAGIMYEEARTCMALGRTDDAVKALERLRDTEPNLLAGRLMLAGLYRDKGLYELSRRECCAILEKQKALNGRPLDPAEKEFIKVDAVELDRLCKAQGGRS